ncbi:hypothetical protein DYB38_000507 [Aphanomyces astaci]|uniref:Uncharacterized protein n=1 Tax=Aphanomyces astaci TaxID=112090 RepID=A0A397E5J2_APHAT|nr:hypothetical protein DYB38_000507 [Aphanomyces astaci]
MSDEASAMAIKLGLRSAYTHDWKANTYHDNACDLFSTVPSVPAAARKRQKPGKRHANPVAAAAGVMELVVGKPTHNKSSNLRSSDRASPQAVTTPPPFAIGGPHLPPSLVPTKERRRPHYQKNQVAPLVSSTQFEKPDGDDSIAEQFPKSNPSSRLDTTHDISGEKSRATRRVDSRQSNDDEYKPLRPDSDMDNTSRRTSEIDEASIIWDQPTLLRYVGCYRIHSAASSPSNALRSITPTSKYYENCERASILPEPIIQKALACKDGILNLRCDSYSMGDTLLLALSESLGDITSLCKINLKDNRLSDHGISTIVGGLVRSRVRELDLSRNYFNAKGIAHIAPLLTSPSSPLMDLVSVITFHGRKNAIETCSVRLETLDLSWNSIGSVTSSEALRAMCTTLAENNVLTHLDLSHNRLLEKDCQLMSNALRGNSSLRGLHIGGNDVDIDAYGVVFPDAAQNDPASAHIFSRFRGNSASKPAWEKRSNCWICERWTEVRFTWKQHSTKPREVLLRAEFDYWTPHHTLPSSHDPTTWEIHRMVPPGTMQFFFVVDGVALTTDAHIVQKFQPRVWGGISNFCRGLDMPASSQVNMIQVEATDILAHIKCKPRSKTPGPGQTDDWFSKSVFCTYQQDTSQHLSNAFESDWIVSRLPKLSKDPNELDKAKQLLAKNFSMLKAVFKHYATSGYDQRESRYCLFIETIAFLAVSKFVKSKRATSVHDAIAMFVQHHIEPHATWHDSQAYRTHKSVDAQPSCLYSPQVDLIFKDHLYLLKEVFASFAGTIDTTPPTTNEKAKRLSFAEFTSLCDEVHLTDESLPARDLKIALMRSKETEVLLKQMVLPVVRARKISIPPLMTRQIRIVATMLQLETDMV